VDEMVKGFLAPLKFNQDVDIAFSILPASGKGTEKAHPFNPQVSNLIPVVSKEGEKLFFILNHRLALRNHIMAKKEAKMISPRSTGSPACQGGEEGHGCPEE